MSSRLVFNMNKILAKKIIWYHAIERLTCLLLLNKNSFVTKNITNFQSVKN